MIELPTERSKPQQYNPKLLVLFGKPKSGKSTIMAALDNNLIVDLEDGYKSLSVMAVQARTANDMLEIAKAIKEKTNKLGKYPYEYITIDNATRLEEICLEMAADDYRKTDMSMRKETGLRWGTKMDEKGNVVIDKSADIRLLPKGAGYLYLRNAIKKVIYTYKKLAPTLILVAHVKDTQINENGEEMWEMSVDLAGKMGNIICGEADAIGYIYREQNKTIISFEGGGNTIKEARPLHLRGRRFIVAESDENNEIKVDLSKIFINQTKN